MDWRIRCRIGGLDLSAVGPADGLVPWPAGPILVGVRWAHELEDDAWPALRKVTTGRVVILAATAGELAGLEDGAPVAIELFSPPGSAVPVDTWAGRITDPELTPTADGNGVLGTFTCADYMADLGVYTAGGADQPEEPRWWRMDQFFTEAGVPSPYPPTGLRLDATLAARDASAATLDQLWREAHRQALHYPSLFVTVRPIPGASAAVRDAGVQTEVRPNLDANLTPVASQPFKLEEVRAINYGINLELVAAEDGWARLSMPGNPDPDAGAVYAENLVPNPSFETGTDSWAPNTVFGEFAGAATLATSTDRAVAGSQSLMVTWPTGEPIGDCVAIGVPGHVDGDYRAAVDVYVPAGSPDVYLGVAFLAVSVRITTKDAWTRVELPYWYGGTTGVAFLLVHTDPDEPSTGGVVYVDAAAMTAGDDPVPYFDGDTSDTAEYAYSWSGPAHASVSVREPYGSDERVADARELVWDGSWSRVRTTLPTRVEVVLSDESVAVTDSTPFGQLPRVLRIETELTDADDALALGEWTLRGGWELPPSGAWQASEFTASTRTADDGFWPGRLREAIGVAGMVPAMTPSGTDFTINTLTAIEADFAGGEGEVTFTLSPRPVSSDLTGYWQQFDQLPAGPTFAQIDPAIEFRHLGYV